MTGELHTHRNLVNLTAAGPSLQEQGLPQQEQITPVGPTYGVADRDAAWNRRRSDLRQLAAVAADLDEVERRASEFNRRVAELLQSLDP